MLILCGYAATLNYCPVAAADEIDPFQVDSGHWMSFDHYTDNVKRNRPVGNESLGVKPVKIEEPELTPAAVTENVKSPEPAANVEAALDPSQPAVAAPTRPLDLPVLPGMNKGFHIQVDSTIDDHNAATPAKIVENKSGESDLHLQEQNWQDASDAARQHARDMAAASDNERIPLDVRMSFLPNPKITPVTAPRHQPRPRLAELPATPKPVIEAAKAPAECAAIDQYKKKQLAAIHSDRQTLQALQSAIAELGLQKQLDFMTGTSKNSTLSTSLQLTPANPAVTGMP